LQRRRPPLCPATSPLTTATRSGREASNAGAMPKITPVNSDKPSIHFSAYPSGATCKFTCHGTGGTEAATSPVPQYANSQPSAPQRNARDPPAYNNSPTPRRRPAQPAKGMPSPLGRAAAPPSSRFPPLPPPPSNTTPATHIASQPPSLKVF